MAIAQETSGTQACTVTTEHSVATRTDAKPYVALVDLTNSVKADEFQVAVKTKILTGSTARYAMLARGYQDVVADPVLGTIPFPSAHHFELLIKQIAGTSRNVDWSVVSLGPAVVQTNSGSTALTTNAALTTLATLTAGKVYALGVDTAILAAEERLIIEAWVKTLTGSTSHRFYRAGFPAGLTNPNVYFPPVAAVWEVVYKMGMTGGSDRTVDWSIVSMT